MKFCCYKLFPNAPHILALDRRLTWTALCFQNKATPLIGTPPHSSKVAGSLHGSYLCTHLRLRDKENCLLFQWDSNPFPPNPTLLTASRGRGVAGRPSRDPGWWGGVFTCVTMLHGKWTPNHERRALFNIPFLVSSLWVFLQRGGLAWLIWEIRLAVIPAWPASFKSRCLTSIF